jgi:hypothetical protein
MTRQSPSPRKRGYPALLNVEEQPHWTIFLTDFALPANDRQRIKRQLETAHTRYVFIRVNGELEGVLRRMRSAGVEPDTDYVSLHAIMSRYENLTLLQELFDHIPHRDLARVDVPILECGFRPSYATQSLNVVLRADYAQQDRIADRFFNLLAIRKPYEVMIQTQKRTLRICDSRPWFPLAGRLRAGALRTLPDGEVAYSALNAEVEGEFVVDGAILPIAQHPRYADESLRLMRLSRQVSKHPVCLRIRRGRVVGLSGRGTAPDIVSKLFESNERYRQLNEVGISFNGASTKFIHRWPAASNEVRPGVHVGIGGAANPEDGDPQRSPFIHIDWMAANCQVFVNGKPFLRASS